MEKNRNVESLSRSTKNGMNGSYGNYDAYSGVGGLDLKLLKLRGAVVDGTYVDAAKKLNRSPKASSIISSPSKILAVLTVWTLSLSVCILASTVISGYAMIAMVAKLRKKTNKEK